MGTAIRFKQSTLPKQQGELARLKVIQGPDYGCVYVLLRSRATIGRGDENDIIISDLKASRIHAEIVGTGDTWNIRDLASANGMLLNGAPTRGGRLKLKDTFKIGETTFEFVAAEAGTMMLIAPPRDIKQIEAEQAAFEAQRKRARGIDSSGSLLGGGAGVRGAAGSGGNRTKLYLGAGAVLMLVLFLGKDEQAPRQKKPEKLEAQRDLASYLPKGAEAAVNRTAEMFYRSGFREFREKNYLRARVQFETVLQIAPGHRLATLYLENCNREITQEVKFHLEVGKKSQSAGKLKDARGHFESVLRLLHRAQSDESYIVAKEQLDSVRKEMKGGVR
ncbi:MAG TPA: hypothetical protein DCS07_14805 [Bdellovibrionales bacterium]|nr:MAG: hypothetical protein A2Z97_15025 [Bdellovibrionales bacterium GWB1_52_6]OFZ03414.1 MAG: hypothetical protein A2X97_05565 [Bdellovibrionales bacterium GWA1_52_35]HAR43880.1 hypothetical protein [Bdellovibrionales bacterium]HCM40996.1 hypothetical protein [Bdellovibrionales bacterium]